MNIKYATSICCYRDIQQRQFEIILTMEGITPETGNTIQVRKRFLTYNYNKLKANFQKGFICCRSVRPTCLMRSCGGTGSSTIACPTTRTTPSTPSPSPASTSSRPTRHPGELPAEYSPDIGLLGYY